MYLNSSLSASAFPLTIQVVQRQKNKVIKQGRLGRNATYNGLTGHNWAGSLVNSLSAALQRSAEQSALGRNELNGLKNEIPKILDVGPTI